MYFLCYAISKHFNYFNLITEEKKEILRIISSHKLSWQKTSNVNKCPQDNFYFHKINNYSWKYFTKNCFYFLAKFCKNDQNPIVIYSEGQSFWNRLYTLNTFSSVMWYRYIIIIFIIFKCCNYKSIVVQFYVIHSFYVTTLIYIIWININKLFIL